MWTKLIFYFYADNLKVSTIVSINFFVEKWFKKECLNPVLSVFDHLNFNSANWSNINDALSNIGWNDELTNLSVDEMLSKITSVVGNICENNCKRKPGNRRRKSKFAYDRRKLIRKRSRIVNKISSHPRKNNSSLVAEVKQIDSDICDSHHNERLSEEHEATSKIASDPKFFYKFAKLHIAKPKPV